MGTSVSPCLVRAVVPASAVVPTPAARTRGRGEAAQVEIESKT
jgi:hypothetical protein